MNQMKNNNEKLSTALKYQALGLSIIPTGLNKVALLSWKKYQTECATKEQIEEWWGQWPDANPALVTGAISKIVVLDIDAKHNRTSKEFPSSPTGYAKSGSGGEHLYFKHPGFHVESKSAVFGLGVDVRGDGGYILLPPSINDKGGIYEWIVPLEEALADMPDWFLKKINNDGKKKINLIDEIPEGSRNDSLASLTGKLLKYFPEREWDSVCLPFLEIWNNSKNNPPLNKSELLTTYQSIKSLELRNGPAKQVEEDLEESISLIKLLNTTFPESRFVVEQFFETGTINMISAPPNKWKSWIVILIAICVASGKLFLDKYKTEKQGVMIVNEEDTERLLQERCNMLMEATEDLPIYFHIGKQIKLNDNFVEKIISETEKKNIGFIIFDSLRSVHDADENSSQEMQKIMDQLKKITRKGITVLFTHHNRKKNRFNNKDESGEDSRGSSAINGAVHGHISCEEDKRTDGTYLVISQPKLKALKKLDPPIEILIVNDIENKKMRFLFQGDYNQKESLGTKAKEKIKELILKSNEWLSIKDIVATEIGKETTVKTALQILEKEMVIKSMERKELLSSGLVLKSKGAHNEKFFFRFHEDGYQHVQETIDWTDPPW